MAEFFGLVIKAKETKNVAIPAGHVLTLANVAYVSKPNESGKFYAGVDRKYVLASFANGRIEQACLDVTFFPGSALSFGLEGDGEVHIIGSLQDYSADAGSSSDEDSLPASRNLKKAMVDDEAEEADSEDDGSDEDDEEDGEDDGEDDDEEEEESDDSADKAPAPKAKAQPSSKSDHVKGLIKPNKDQAQKDQPQKNKPSTPAPAKSAPSTPAANKTAASTTPASKTGAPKPAAATTPSVSKLAAATTPAAKAPQTPKADASTPSAAKDEKKRPAGTTPKADGSAKKSKTEAKSPAGGVKCDSCSGKPFPSQHALDQHNVAKHGATPVKV